MKKKTLLFIIVEQIFDCAPELMTNVPKYIIKIHSDARLVNETELLIQKADRSVNRKKLIKVASEIAMKKCDPKIGKMVLTILLEFKVDYLVSNVCDSIKSVLGPLNGEARSQCLPIVNLKTVTSCLTAILSHIQTEIANLQESYCKVLSLNDPESSYSKEKSTMKELVELCGFLQTLCEAQITSSDKLLRCLTHLYKAGSAITKAKSEFSRVTSEYKAFVDTITEKLTPAVYIFLPFSQNTTSVKGLKKKNKRVSFDREGSIHSNLIYSIERFEQDLIALSKNTELELKDFQTVSRDFKIHQ